MNPDKQVPHVFALVEHLARFSAGQLGAREQSTTLRDATAAWITCETAATLDWAKAVLTEAKTVADRALRLR